MLSPDFDKNISLYGRSTLFNALTIWEEPLVMLYKSLNNRRLEASVLNIDSSITETMAISKYLDLGTAYMIPEKLLPTHCLRSQVT